MMQIGQFKEGEWLYLGKAYRVRDAKFETSARAVMKFMRFDPQAAKYYKEDPDVSSRDQVWYRRSAEFFREEYDATLVSVSALLVVSEKSKIPQLRLRVTPEDKTKKGETLTLDAEDVYYAARPAGAVLSPFEIAGDFFDRVDLAFFEGGDERILEYVEYVYHRLDEYGLREENVDDIIY